MIFNISSLFTAMLLATRLGVVFLATPVMTQFRFPAQVKTLLCVALAFALSIGLPQFRVAVPASALHAFFMLIGEAVAGALIAITISTGFAAFSVAARLIDVQIGYGIGQVFDPVSQRQAPVLSSLVAITSVAAFFSMDAHHALLRAFAFLLSQWPPGSAILLPANASWVFIAGGKMYAAGLALVGPVVMSVLLTEIGLAIVARTMPQMNLFVLGLPIKIAVGLTTFSIWASHMASVASSVFDQISNSVGSAAN